MPEINKTYLSTARKSILHAEDGIVAIWKPAGDTVKLLEDTLLVTDEKEIERTFEMMTPVNEIAPNVIVINPRLLLNLLRHYEFNDALFVQLEITGHHYAGCDGLKPILSISAPEAVGFVAGMVTSSDSPRVYRPWEK